MYDDRFVDPLTITSPAAARSFAFHTNLHISSFKTRVVKFDFSVCTFKVTSCVFNTRKLFVRPAMLI